MNNDDTLSDDPDLDIAAPEPIAEPDLSPGAPTVMAPRNSRAGTAWATYMTQSEDTSSEAEEEAATEYQEAPSVHEGSTRAETRSLGPIKCASGTRETMRDGENSYGDYAVISVAIDPGFPYPVSLQDILATCCGNRVADEAGNQKSYAMTAVTNPGLVHWSESSPGSSSVEPGTSVKVYCYLGPAAEPLVPITKPDCSCLHRLLWKYASQAQNDPKSGEKLDVLLQMIGAIAYQATRRTRGQFTTDVDHLLEKLSREAEASGVDLNCSREGASENWGDVRVPSSTFEWLKKRLGEAVDKIEKRLEAEVGDERRRTGSGTALDTPGKRIEAMLEIKARQAFQQYLDGLAQKETGGAADIDAAWKRASQLTSMKKLVNYANRLGADHPLAKNIYRFVANSHSTLVVPGAPQNVREFLAQPGGHPGGATEQDISKIVANDFRFFRAGGATTELSLNAMDRKATPFLEEGNILDSRSADFNAFVAKLDEVKVTKGGVERTLADEFGVFNPDPSRLCSDTGMCSTMAQGAKFSDVYDKFAEMQAWQLADYVKQNVELGEGLSGLLKRGLEETKTSNVFSKKFLDQPLGKIIATVYSQQRAGMALVASMVSGALDLATDPDQVTDAVTQMISDTYLRFDAQNPGESIGNVLRTVRSVASDMIGLTQVVEAITGKDSITGEPIDFADRLDRGFEGLNNLILTVADPAITVYGKLAKLRGAAKLGKGHFNPCAKKAPSRGSVTGDAAGGASKRPLQVGKELPEGQPGIAHEQTHGGAASKKPATVPVTKDIGQGTPPGAVHEQAHAAGAGTPAANSQAPTSGKRSATTTLQDELARAEEAARPVPIEEYAHAGQATGSRKPPGESKTFYASTKDKPHGVDKSLESKVNPVESGPGGTSSGGHTEGAPTNPTKLSSSPDPHVSPPLGGGSGTRTGSLKEILVASEQKSITLGEGWAGTKFGSAQDSIVYILRDTTTGELLEVGKTEVAKFRGRFGPYARAARRTGRSLSVDTFTFRAEGFNAEKIEAQVREYLLSKGHKLPWDNTGSRLGRPGPGVPGVRVPRPLRNDGWHWDGERLVQ